MNRFSVAISLPEAFEPVINEVMKPGFVEKGFDINECFYRTPLDEEQVINHLENADSAVVGRDKISRRVVEKARNLKIICVFGTGVDNIDVAAAKNRGIYVTNVPGANAIAVAELTIGLIFNCMRHITFSHEELSHGLWKLSLGSECEGKILGIIGLGRIGKQVAKRAYYLGFEIKAFDIRHDYDFASRYNIEYIDLDLLLRISDIVTLHVPLDSSTREMIGRDQIHLMKRSSYLINTSRGEVVDEHALIEALESNAIVGAALDVFDKEPPRCGNRLLQHDSDRTVVTSHIGGGTIEATQRIAEVIRNNVILVSNRKKPSFIV